MGLKRHEQHTKGELSTCANAYRCVGVFVALLQYFVWILVLHQQPVNCTTITTCQSYLHEYKVTDAKEHDPKHTCGTVVIVCWEHDVWEKISYGNISVMALTAGLDQEHISYGNILVMATY